MGHLRLRDVNGVAVAPQSVVELPALNRAGLQLSEHKRISNMSAESD